MAQLAKLRPMLLDARAIDCEAPGWIFETKYDGYRMLAEFGNGSCRLKSRHGANTTAWFPELYEALSNVPGGPYVVDGEVCVLDESGHSDYRKLQARAKRRRCAAGSAPVTYCVFDLLMEKNLDRTELPLSSRKALLHELFTPAPPSVILVKQMADNCRAQLSQAQRPGLEGMVAKRADSIYQPGVRSRDWVKFN